MFAERCVGARQPLKECTGYKCCGVFPSLPPLVHTSEIFCPLPNLFQCTKAMLLLHPCLVIPILGVFWHRLLILLFPLPASPSWTLGPTCRCEATGFPGAEAWPWIVESGSKFSLLCVYKSLSYFFISAGPALGLLHSIQLICFGIFHSLFSPKKLFQPRFLGNTWVKIPLGFKNKRINQNMMNFPWGISALTPKEIVWSSALCVWGEDT